MPKKRQRSEAEHSSVEDNMPRHNELCNTCGEGGELLCCHTCNLVFHLPCADLDEVPAGVWRCKYDKLAADCTCIEHV